MPDGREAIAIKVIDSLSDVEAAAWDACAGGGDPFVTHAFLSALEDSGSVADETGWAARHLTITDSETGRLAAVAPFYVKNHSYGEYVFDWAWADAYSRAGGRYYPKAVCAIPFTPVTGRRLLVRRDAPEPMRSELADALAAGMTELAGQLNLSSVHVNFTCEEEWQRLGRAGFLLRIGEQFHWQNGGYQSFDDFLGRLTSRKRKAIVRERRQVAATGVALKTLSGSEISEGHWDAFYRFYRDTSDRKWGEAYLTREFFSLLGERMPQAVVLVLAQADGKTVAGALNLKGRDTLYGRYWGCRENYKFLHFEACYYQAIDYAIRHGLSRIEAGAQGPHKIQRGYLPNRTLSAHWIANPGFRGAVSHFLDGERRMVEAEINELAARSPYRGEPE